jgi:hypothetical protein
VAQTPNPRPHEDKPPERGGRPVELDSIQFQLICEELARIGSKYKACEALGFEYITVKTAIKAQEDLGDDSWRAAWDDAYERFKDTLEQAAFGRARDGVITRWRFSKQKDGTYLREPEEMEYSDRLMEVLLKGHFPDRYRDKLYVAGTVGLEPVDAFANLSTKAKRQIREIIMADLEEQRQASTRMAAAQTIEAQATDVTAQLEDMRQQEGDE